MLRRSLAYITAATFALTACGHHASESLPLPSTADTNQLASLRYPIQATELSINESYTLSYAEDILMEPCMEAAGFTWEPIEPPKQYISPDSRRYGVMDIYAANRYGYRLPPPPPEASARIRRDNTLTPLERETAFGPAGRSGCYGKAHKEIAGTALEVDLKLFNELNRKSLENSKMHPNVAKVVKAWRKCMKGSGYTYNDPFEAAGDPRWKGAKTPSKEERYAAVADVKCKHKAALIPTWASVEYALQNKYIQQNAGYFSRITSSKKERLKNMQAVLDTRN
jgi:hypothetical protein